MRKIQKTITVEVLDFKELTAQEKILIRRAHMARLNAQAPYSNYWVGCSLVTADGFLVDGCNVERASWTQTDHAEQVAISSAVAQLGTCRIAAMAVVGGHAEQEIFWPPTEDSVPSHPLITSVSDVCPSCGQCLQIIAENCFDEDGLFDPTIPLLGYDGGEICRTTIGDAYPMPFLPQYLGINYSEDPRFKEKLRN